jgi:MraZ protein
MGMFVGNYEISLDDKNRISIPSRVRKAIPADEDSHSWYVAPGRRKTVLELYCKRYYEQLARQVPGSIFPDDESADFDEVAWAFVDIVDMDKQGRMLLPEWAISQAGLGKELVLYGARDRLILMNRNEFGEKIAPQKDRLPELRARARNQADMRVQGESS